MSVGKRQIRFEDFIMKEGTCWVWKGSYSGKGDPIYISRNKAKNARLHCFEKHVCPAHGIKLESKCKDPRCIKPEHQKVVKSTDNKTESDTP